MITLAMITQVKKPAGQERTKEKGRKAAQLLILLSKSLKT